jgi:hypothetical protein
MLLFFQRWRSTERITTYYTADLRRKYGFGGIMPLRLYRLSFRSAYTFSRVEGYSSSMLAPNRPTPKLLDQVRTIARVKHFSLSTERAYVSWIRRFILFHGKQHPKEMAEGEIRQFISHLAVDAKISASTHGVMKC